MGFVKDVGRSLKETFTGSEAAKASREAARIQQAGIQQGIGEIRGAEDRALGFLSPFEQLGTTGLEQAGFLTDPQAQFDFIQQNPLFQAALNKATTETQNQAAARGRLSAGDTLQRLSENVLLSATPLIQEQKRSIMDLLNIGTGIAGGQAGITTATGGNVADLITSGAAAEAAGEIGAAQARGRAGQNLLLGGILAGKAAISSGVGGAA